MFETERPRAVLDFVADLGADPDGDEPIDDALTALNTLRGTVKVTVPDGRYRLSGAQHALRSPEGGARILEAETGANPRFVAPAEHRGPWLGLRTNGAMRGIDIDRTAGDCSPELHIAPPDRFELADMTIEGRESLPAQVQGHGVISVASSPGGTIRMTDVDIPEGTEAITSIGGPQPGVVVGPHHEGELIMTNCDIRTCSSHGVDAARAAGPVKIYNSRFINNNRSQIRFCGPGSEVASTTVVVDLRSSRIPTESYARTAGIWNEALTPRREAHPPSGGIVDDTLIAVRTGPLGSLWAGYYGSPLAGGMSVRGCDVVVDVADVPAVSVAAPERVLDDYPPQPPHGIELTQSAFRGRAGSGVAVEIEGRPTSSLTLSCIAQPEQRRAYALPQEAAVRGLNTHGRCSGPPRTR